MGFGGRPFSNIGHEVHVDTGCLDRMPVVSEETQLLATANMLPANGLTENEDDGWESLPEEE